MLGQFQKTASGHDSYEIYEAEDLFVFEVVKIIHDQFGFKSNLPVYGPGEIYVDCKLDTIKITVGWDNWSGCFVMSYSRKGDEVVREIGEYLNTLLSDLDLS